MWRSVRSHGDTKTERSRRTLGLAQMAVDALQAHKERQVEERLAAGGQWSDHDLVFSTRSGDALDAANVRREFKAACRAAGIGEHWTPRELRHSFVSLMSTPGVPVEEIAGGRPLQHQDHRGGLQARTAGLSLPLERRRWTGFSRARQALPAAGAGSAGTLAVNRHQQPDGSGFRCGGPDIPRR